MLFIYLNFSIGKDTDQFLLWFQIFWLLHLIVNSVKHICLEALP